MQPHLPFERRSESGEPQRNILGVDGLHYFPGFVSQTESDLLMAGIDAASWQSDISRRVQQYGFRYSYERRVVDPFDVAPPIPGWADELRERLVRLRIFEKLPDQIIVNEYLPGQGIAPHVDRAVFGEVVGSLSLLSPVVMDFAHREGEERRSLVLEPLSLLVLERAARYHWTHGIAKRRSDSGTQRGRRISLTLRTVKEPRA